MAGMNGSVIPAPLLDRLDAVADQPDEIGKIGIEVATELGAALLAEDAPGLHLYALNRSAVGQADPRQPRPRLSPDARQRRSRSSRAGRWRCGRCAHRAAVGEVEDVELDEAVALVLPLLGDDARGR